MPRPRQVSDEQILSAAKKAFLEHGPGVSTSEIAEAVGLSHAALFKRFGTKEALMLKALVPSGPPAFVTKVESGPDERPIDEQLVEIGLEISAFMDEIIPCMAMLRASDISQGKHIVDPETGVPHPIRGARALADFVAQAQAEGRMGGPDPMTIAMGLLGGLQSRAFLGHVAQGHLTLKSKGQHVKELVALLWNGVRPEEEP